MKITNYKFTIILGIAIILCMIIIALFIFSNLPKKIIISALYDNTSLTTFLQWQNIKYSEKDENINLRLSKNNIDQVIKIAAVYRLLYEISIENINNWETTRTPESSPYRRQILIINENQEIEIKSDQTSPLRLVYDPIHPDAIQNGPKRGYVEYPNVDPEFELTELSIWIMHYNLLRKIVIENSNSRYLPEISDEIIRRLATEIEIQKFSNVTSQVLLDLLSTALD